MLHLPSAIFVIYGKDLVNAGGCPKGLTSCRRIALFCGETVMVLDDVPVAVESDPVVDYSWVASP